MAIPHYISEEAALLICAGTSEYLTPGDTFRSTGYGGVESFILSKNRTAKALFQTDGNFVVYTGKFSDDGKPLTNVAPVFASTQYLKKDADFKIRTGPYKMVLNQGLKIIREKDNSIMAEIITIPNYIAGKQALKIEDSGNLIYTFNGKPVWSLFTPEQIANLENSQNKTSNYILPFGIGAALLGLYFYLK
jgi:hypothetical protein